MTETIKQKYENKIPILTGSDLANATSEAKAILGGLKDSPSWIQFADEVRKSFAERKIKNDLINACLEAACQGKNTWTIAPHAIMDNLYHAYRTLYSDMEGISQGPDFKLAVIQCILEAMRDAFNDPTLQITFVEDEKNDNSERNGHYKFSW